MVVAIENFIKEVKDAFFALDLEFAVKVLEIAGDIDVRRESNGAFRALVMPNEVFAGTSKTQDALATVTAHFRHYRKTLAVVTPQLC